MHDGIYLGYLGLTELEVKVLKSIFTLAPQLKDNFRLLPPDQVRHADMVLVNADDPETIRQWTELRQSNKLMASLILTDNDKLAESDMTVRRPIRVQKLVAALETVVETTSIDVEDAEDPGSAFEILVVDDSFPVRKYMEHKLGELSQYPININFASNGEEAIRKAAEHDYGLIFLDVMMEGMDGYKVCKHIKSSCDAYIVMLTSKKSPFDKVRGTMSGCDAYITKPPEDDRITEELRKSLLRHSQQFIDVAQA